MFQEPSIYIICTTVPDRVMIRVIKSNDKNLDDKNLGVSNLCLRERERESKRERERKGEAAPLPNTSKKTSMFSSFVFYWMVYVSVFKIETFFFVCNKSSLTYKHHR